MKNLTFIGLIACVFLTSHSVHAVSLFNRIGDLEWGDGENRFEVYGSIGLNSGSKSRSGDFGLVGAIEREFPLYKKLSVGLRAIPVFFYDEDDSDGHTIFGAGGGFSFRFYAKESQDGLFCEIQESIMIHSEKFLGNGSHFNFMSECGVGYQFDNEWFTFAKWRHISNAGLSNDNSGINNLSVGFGKRF